MEIKDSFATFDINMQGAKTGSTYMGSFKVKCLPTPMDTINADVDYRNKMGNNIHLASDDAQHLAFALYQLKYLVVDYENAPFWDNRTLPGSHIPDHNVIMEVFNKAVEAQEKWMELKDKEAKEMEEVLKNAMKNKVIEKEPELEDEES